MAAMQEALIGWTDVQIADEILRLDPVDQAVLFRVLSKAQALDVFEKLEPANQISVLNGLRADEVAHVVEELEPDDRARLLDEMPAGVAARLLAEVSPDERERTSMLLGYGAESAGRIMTPEYVSIHAEMSAADAIVRIRHSGIDAETIYVLYVKDPARRLIGVTSLKTLVLADPDTPVSELMTSDIVTATTGEDQERVARRLVDNDLLAIPVVDSEQRIVGIITIDDAIDILRQEETEDAARIGGTTPLDRPYLSAGVMAVVKSRIGWLLVLFVAEMFTGTVMRAFQESLDKVVALAFFIPLLIDTGGNAGSQTTTTIVRAMAIGEVRIRDVTRVVWKELRVGLILGAIMACFGLIRASTWGTGHDLALVVGLGLMAVVMLATFIGSVLPIGLKKLNLDPAVVSAPFITTFVDGIGLLIYFTLAKTIMGI